MEVTNNNTNQFAPKLGQAGPDAFSSDAFSSHLAETTSYASSQADARAEDRDAHARENHAEDQRAEERHTDAEKAASAEEDRRADAENRDAEARDSADDETHQENQTSSDDAELDLSATGTGAGALLTNDDTLSAEDEAALNIEPTAAASEVEDVANTNSTDATGSTENQSANDASQTETQALAAAIGPDADEDSALDTSVTDETDADDIAIQAANSADRASSANAEAAAGANAQQAARPAQTAASQTAQNAAQTTAGPEGQTTGLPNPLEGAMQSDVDGDADGGKGLGHQAAEAMAGKNKTATASTQAPTAGQSAPTTSAAAVTPVTPMQALASAGLNLSSLPADLNLDLLNLNAPNQAAPAGMPQNSNPVLVRFGALPGQAQATQVPNTAIALQISKHVAKGVSTFQIRLDPAEMGRIDVKLELAQDGRVTAHLTVEKAETLDLLQKDAKALEQALKDAGLDADSDTLNFSLKNGSADNAADSGAEQLANGDETSSTETDAEDTAITALASRQIEAAARGGIDVSI